MKQMFIGGKIKSNAVLTDEGWDKVLDNANFCLRKMNNDQIKIKVFEIGDKNNRPITVKL